MARRILSSRETPRQPDVFNVFAAREAESDRASDARQGASQTHHRCHAKPELARGAKRSAGWIEARSALGVGLSLWIAAAPTPTASRTAPGLASDLSRIDLVAPDQASEPVSIHAEEASGHRLHAAGKPERADDVIDGKLVVAREHRVADVLLLEGEREDFVKVARFDDGSRRADARAKDHVLELAHVSGPGVGLEDAQ